MSVATRPTVLVVEDNPITRKLVRVSLAGMGVEVIEAADGRTSLGVVGTEVPDLILLDLRLPDVDGIELARRLRRLAGGEETPILAFSGSLSGLEEARLSSVGFSEVLLKPVEPSRLVDVVKTYLPTPLEADSAWAAGKRALVVDDDPLQRKLMSLRLRHLGFTVETAADGRQALAKASEQPPDVIISDVLMPDVDGFGLCVAARNDPRLREVPIVLTTCSYLDDEDREHGADAGADAYVVRTPDLREVLAALPAVLAAPQVTRAVSTGRDTSDRTHRLIRQLERQAAINSNLSQLCTLQAAQLSALTGISDALTRTAGPELAFPEILARCLDAASIPQGALYVIGPDGGFLRAHLGYGEDVLEELHGFFGQLDLLHQVIEEGVPTLVPSTAMPADTARALLERAGGKPLLLVPIIARGIRIGALVMQWQPERSPDLDWTAFARAAAAQIGQAVALYRSFSRLKTSDARYRGLFEAAGDAMILTDEGSRIIEANPSACRITGYPESDIRGLGIDGLLTAAGEQSAGAAETRGDYTLRRRDGSSRQVEMSVSRTGVGLRLHVFNDVTDERQFRARMAQTEKLAAMGQLLAGVAHELNNPLTVIQGQTLLLARTCADPAVQQRAEKIGQAGDRCARIVKNFLALARQRPPERRPVGINSLINETVELLAYSLRVDNVQVVTELAADCPLIWADPHQVQQVIVNLLSNANDAMRGMAGIKEIRIASRSGPEPGHITVELADTGPGIPAEVRARIFEPFFTTKAPGSGTGLGLSLCLASVESHGGTMTVESEPGHGARFRVVLPLGEGESRGADDRGARPEPIRGASILVVDDEPEVAETLRDLLTADGHQVVIADTGVRALDAVQQRAFDLVISDIRMPGLDGRGLYDAVAARFPALLPRLVFVTGDTLSRETVEFLQRTEVPCLGKPLALDEIRLVLEARLKACRAPRAAVKAA
jgi:two-component system NtrC family sensor kinase